jgi:CO/xanthine dehydrogenase FAD-binding subunit
MGNDQIGYRIRKKEEHFMGKRLSEDLIKSSAEVALEEARPLRGNGYNVPLAKALIQQALVSLFNGT